MWDFFVCEVPAARAEILINLPIIQRLWEKQQHFVKQERPLHADTLAGWLAAWDVSGVSVASCPSGGSGTEGCWRVTCGAERERKVDGSSQARVSKRSYRCMISYCDFCPGVLLQKCECSSPMPVNPFSCVNAIFPHLSFSASKEDYLLGEQFSYSSYDVITGGGSKAVFGNK